MKASKVQVSIKISALSIDVLEGMLAEVISQVKQETESGKLVMTDGDSIKWKTKRKNVKF